MRLIRIINFDTKKKFIRRIRKNSTFKLKGKFYLIEPKNVIYNSFWPHRVVIIYKNEFQKFDYNFIVNKNFNNYW